MWNIFIQAYIGNLTWWTTDADISDSVASIGVTDFIEVKFYENRINGQSKGFCSVYVGSETSLRLLMDQMPKKELHGQKPEVTYATKVRQSRANVGHTCSFTRLLFSATCFYQPLVFLSMSTVN